MLAVSIGNPTNNTNNIFRIGDDTIIRLYDINDTKEYIKYKSQYIIKNQYIWDETVWVDEPYAKRLNRVYSNAGLINYPETYPAQEYISTCAEIMLQQGYSFNGIFGFHILLLNMDTNEVYNSQIVIEDDFKITTDKLLIDGSFWMQSAKIYIPKITGNLCAQITEIKYNDISLESTNIGALYNFPESVIPLRTEKPMTDSLRNVIELDENFYLHIKIINEDTRTIEQTILDYFGFDYAEITFQHVVNYGNPEVGYEEIIVSNNVNKYGDIWLGLNLNPIANSDITNKNVDITVTTQAIVNNSLMERIATITVNAGNIMNPLIGAIIKHPETNYPVNVEIVQKIEQTVVKQNKQVRFITIQQPVYAELIVDEFKIENKNIVFTNLSVPAHLIIAKSKSSEEQNIASKTLSDGTIYFDISDLVPVSEETTYQLIDKESMKVIGNGKVIV